MEASDLLSALRESVQFLVGGRRRIAVAYSGGLDSSIIAHLSKEVSEVVCYTAAVKGSSDHINVRSYAEEEGLELRLIELTEELMRSHARTTATALGTLDPVKISYTLPIVTVLEHSEEELILAGSGADELFGGYAKYERMEDPTNQMKDDFERMVADAALLSAVAEDRGKRIGFPFASGRVVSAAHAMLKSGRIADSERKAVLRDMARGLRLSSHDRPKKAAQYSSGVYKEMKRLAKADGQSLDGWTRSLTGRT